MKNDNFIVNQILSNKKNKKIIVSDNKKKISWSDLYKISKLNYHIIKRNKSKIIPIICDRSVKTFVSIISVIMSGKTFCPISDKYPEFRVKHIMKKIDSDFLINNSNFKVSGVKNYNIKMSRNLNLNKKYKDIFKLNTSENKIAYVLFTSGSTGEAKGVKLSYDNLLNTIIWSKKYLDWKKKDIIGIATNFSFDISMFDLLTCIYFKVHAHILNNPENPVITFKEINTYKITSIFSVPAFFSNFVYYDIISKKFSNLRRIISGGDFFPAKSILAWKKYNEKIDIFNVWGPTETSIVNTMFKITKKNLYDLSKGKSLPVGKSDKMMEIKIYSKKKFLNRPLTKGQICMFGKCVSEGYIGDKKNKKNYIYRNGMRGFLTGDIGYFDLNRRLHITGRTDSTVKLSGYRVDLKEIENITLESSHVLDCKAFVIKKKLFQSLVLCILSKKKMDMKNIKSHLGKKLPSYAIPKFTFFFKKFPKNKNFKVDINKLKKISTKNIQNL